VTGLADTAWKTAIRRLDFPFLRIVVAGSPEEQDLYCEWQRVREIEEAGALLVRPDGVVAWRSKDGAVGCPGCCGEAGHGDLCRSRPAEPLHDPKGASRAIKPSDITLFA
jgi:Aromatic-ring hydroxylase, C-terminal